MPKRENRKVSIIIEYNSDDACELWALTSYITECSEKNEMVPVNILKEFFNKFSNPAIEKREKDLVRAKNDFKEIEEKTITRFTDDKYFKCKNKIIVRNLVREVCKNMINKKLNFWDAIEKKNKRQWLCRTIILEIVSIRNAQRDEIQNLLTRYLVNSIAGFMVHSFGFSFSNNSSISNKLLTQKMYKRIPDYPEIIKNSQISISFPNHEIDLESETQAFVSDKIFLSPKKSSIQTIDPFNDKP